jgi:hypothetical protein
MFKLTLHLTAHLHINFAQKLSPQEAPKESCPLGSHSNVLYALKRNLRDDLEEKSIRSICWQEDPSDTPIPFGAGWADRLRCGRGGSIDTSRGG